MDGAETLLIAIVAIIFPPAAVAFLSGCGVDLCINILLTCLGWLPGCIHAFWLLIRRSDANEKYGYKHWTYMGNGNYRPIAPIVQPPYTQAPPPPPAKRTGTDGYDAKPAQTQTQTQTQTPANQKQTGYTAPPSQPVAPATGDQKADYTAPPPMPPPSPGV